MSNNNVTVSNINSSESPITITITVSDDLINIYRGVIVDNSNTLLASIKGISVGVDGDQATYAFSQIFSPEVMTHYKNMLTRTKIKASNVSFNWKLEDIMNAFTIYPKGSDQIRIKRYNKEAAQLLIKKAMEAKNTKSMFGGPKIAPSDESLVITKFTLSEVINDKAIQYLKEKTIIIGINEANTVDVLTKLSDILNDDNNEYLTNNSYDKPIFLTQLFTSTYLSKFGRHIDLWAKDILTNKRLRDIKPDVAGRMGGDPNNKTKKKKYENLSNKI